MGLQSAHSSPAKCMYSTANDPYGKQCRSFAVELDHSRSGDHLRSGIIRGPAQVCELDLLILLFALRKKKNSLRSRRLEVVGLLRRLKKKRFSLLRYSFIPGL